MSDENSSESSRKKKEIYTYDAPWPTYALGWSRGLPNDDKLSRLAVASFKEEYSNKVNILQLHRDDVSGTGSFEKLAEFDHPYPATKVIWCPPGSDSCRTGNSYNFDVLATTGDYLRLWSLGENNNVEMIALLNNNRHTEYCAPLTSFDWNEVDKTVIGTCSIDTTVTIWDIEVLQPKTQLIAHDKEVFDIAFSAGKDIFATVGADGSLRMFDLRYESPELTPLLRVIWNKLEPNHIATIFAESKNISIVDVRMPSMVMLELTGHRACVSSIAWAPQSSQHICSVGDDRQALIWDLAGAPNTNTRVIEEPVLAYTASKEINCVNWGLQHDEWVTISYANNVQVLRV